MKKFFVVSFVLVAVTLVTSGCGIFATKQHDEEVLRQACWDMGGLLGKDNECVLQEIKADVTSGDIIVDCGSKCGNAKTGTAPAPISDNVKLLLDLGFPGSEWVIPEKAQKWACPQELAQGDKTYGPFSETKDSEKRVWIGIGSKKATMTYTYSFAGCKNPAEAITEQGFFTGREKSPVDKLVFNVIFDGEKVNRELTFPD